MNIQHHLLLLLEQTQTAFAPLPATFYHFLPPDKLILVQTSGNGKEFFTLFQ